MDVWFNVAIDPYMNISFGLIVLKKILYSIFENSNTPLGSTVYTEMMIRRRKKTQHPQIITIANPDSAAPKYALLTENAQGSFRSPLILKLLLRLPKST